MGRIATLLLYVGFLVAGTARLQAQVPEPAAPGAQLSAPSADALSIVAHGVMPTAAGAPRSRPVVVLIPGTIGSAFSMRHLTAALTAAGVSSVVIDPLGMGTSSRPEKADYTLSRQAARIGRILDSLHIEQAVVVAQGTSATIALHLAADDSTRTGRARVAGVLSLAGGPVDRQGTRGVKLALALSPLLDNALGRSVGRRKFRAAVREQSADDAWCTDSVLRVYLTPYERDLRGSLRALRAMSEAVEPVAIAERLPSVRVPVRLLVGDKVSGNAPTSSQIAVLSQSLPRFRVDTVPRAGTMLQEEQPAAVVQAIRQLLSAVKRP